MAKMTSKLRKVLTLLTSGKFDLITYGLLKQIGFRNVLPPLPFSLMIEPTNACDLHCPTCPTGSGKMNRPRRMMSFAEFKGIIDQVRGYVNVVLLWNYGEPFLNKELLRMIKYASSSGMYVITSTHGGFFKSQELCVEVVQSGLHELIVCLDGADQETISKFRRGAKFSEIINGFHFIRDAKKKFDLKTPIIELQFILMKHNEHQRNYMKELANQLGVDVYLEKLVGIDYNDPEFQKLAKEFLPNDLSLSPYYVKNDGTFMINGEIVNDCPWIYKSAVINSDGTVVPCCYDLYSKYVMGNVFEESLKKIWRSSKYQAFRTQIRRDRKSMYKCNVCRENRVFNGKRINRI